MNEHELLALIEKIEARVLLAQSGEPGQIEVLAQEIAFVKSAIQRRCQELDLWAAKEEAKDAERKFNLYMKEWKNRPRPYHLPLQYRLEVMADEFMRIVRSSFL